MAFPSPTLRRARGAVAALFLTNGALLANLLPRYPEIKAELGLTNSTYGLVLAAFPAGAILAGLGAGSLIRRMGSAPLAVAGTLTAGDRPVRRARRAAHAAGADAGARRLRSIRGLWGIRGVSRARLARPCPVQLRVDA